MVFRSAFTHRETLDGTGYPEGLMGDEIPVGGRIIAVADTFLALTSPSPKRDAYGRDEALSIIVDGRGERFDAGVVDVLAAVLAD